MWRSRIVINCSLFVTVLFSTFWCLNAEEECMRGNYKCYECDTVTDQRCKDPFNASAPQNELPPLKVCSGCCVKIVMYADTPRQVVRRTCTKSLQINLFMVDHVCMYEGGNTGHMCFCERDNCNSAEGTSNGRWTLIFSVCVGLLFLKIPKIFLIF